jgi:FkbM family methyltransferase
VTRIRQADDGWWVPRDRFVRDKRHPVQSQQRDLACIDIALAHANLVPGWQCVQAGARVGLWPIELAERGAHVHAFEPEPVNFDCALRNVTLRGHSGRVTLTRAALGAQTRPLYLSLSRESNGEHYVGKNRFSILVPATTIDLLKLEHCAAIFLDLEGYELEALVGAVETLRRCKPVVVVEENALCARYHRERGDVERFMAGLGYRLVDEFSTLAESERIEGVFHGSDLIFAT